VKIKTRNHVLI